jgi:Tfp pilus assembly protein PilO
MNSEKKLIFLTIILTILIIFNFFLTIRPLYQEVKNLSDKIKSQIKLSEELYLKGYTLAETKKKLKEIEDKIPILENVFLLEGKELEFITTLEKIARQNKISQEINLEAKKIFRTNYKFLPVTLSLKGEFQNLIKYFLEMEKLDFYFNIDSFSLTQKKEKEIEVIVKGKTFWRMK